MDATELRPERVQAAFEVWRGQPDTGPNATAIFEYVELLESRLAASEAALSEAREAHRETRDRAVKALRPFAEVAAEYDEREDPNHEVWLDVSEPVVRTSMRLELYVRARYTLAELLKDGGGNPENRANSVAETPAS